MDDLEFTPPPSPTQHNSQDSVSPSSPSLPPMNGVMGTSPSKDMDVVEEAGTVTTNNFGDADGAHGAADASTPNDKIPSSQGSAGSNRSNRSSGSNRSRRYSVEEAGGGILASLDPPHSPAAVGNNGPDDRSSANDENHTEDPNGLTPSIDYNGETQKFAPSGSVGIVASPVAASAARTSGSGHMSPLTEDQSRNGSDDETETLNSDEEDEIAQDGMYPVAGDDDDSSDNEEFGSMPMNGFQDTGMLTQGAVGDHGTSDESSVDEVVGRSAGNDDDEDDASEGDDSHDGERSQALLDNNAGESSGPSREGTEEAMTVEVEAEVMEESPLEGTETAGTATEDEDENETEIAGLEDENETEIAGLTEPTEVQTEPGIAIATLADSDVVEKTDSDSIDEQSNGNDTAMAAAATVEEEEEEEEEDEEVLGLTEQSEMQTEMDGSKDCAEIAGTATAESMDAKNAAEPEILGSIENMEQQPKSALAASGSDGNGDGFGRDGASEVVDETNQRSEANPMSELLDSQRMPPPAAPHRSILDAQSPPRNIWANDEDKISSSVRNGSISLGTSETSQAENSPSKEAADAVDVDKQGTTPVSVRSQSAKAPMESPARKLAIDGTVQDSEDTYDSFRDLPIYSGATQDPIALPSSETFTANENSPLKGRDFQIPNIEDNYRDKSRALFADSIVGKGRDVEDATDRQCSEDSHHAEVNGRRAMTMADRKERSQDSQTAAGNDEGVKTGDFGPSANLNGESVEGETEGTASTVEGDLFRYDNDETEPHRTEQLQSPNNGRESQADDAVDTNASTPLISHTQTHIEERTDSAGYFSYPRNDDQQGFEEKKTDLPSPSPDDKKPRDSNAESATVVPTTTTANKRTGSKDSEMRDVAETATVVPTPTPKKMSALTPTSNTKMSERSPSADESKLDSLTTSSLPMSQPLLTPSTVQSPKNTNARSLLETVEASNAAISGRGQRGDGRNDEIEDSDDDLQEKDGAEIEPSKSTDAIMQEQESNKNGHNKKKGREEANFNEQKAPVDIQTDVTRLDTSATPSKDQALTKRVPVTTDAPWIQRHHHHQNHTKIGLDTGTSTVPERGESQDDNSSSSEDDSPRMRIPSTKPALRRKAMEAEADDFSSGEHLTNAFSRKGGHSHPLQDMQDSLSDFMDDDAALKAKKGASGTRTSSARKRLKKIGESNGKNEADSSPPPPSSSRAAKRKAKRTSSIDHDAQDTLARLGGNNKNTRGDSSDEEMGRKDDQDDDDSSVSSSDFGTDRDIGGPSQNTVEIDDLISNCSKALKKFSAQAKDPGRQIEKLKGKVARLEKKNSELKRDNKELKDDYERVCGENVVLKQKLSKKAAQNIKMKKLLSAFNKHANGYLAKGSPDDDDMFGYNSESSIDVDSAPPSPPPQRKEKRKKEKKGRESKSKTSSSEGSSVVEDRPRSRPKLATAASTASPPTVVPPSSVKPRGRSGVSSSSSSKQKSIKRRQETLASATSDDSEEDIVLSKLKTPKGKGKKACISPSTNVATSATKRRKSYGGGGGDRDGSTSRGGRSSRRRGGVSVIPKDMANVRLNDVWRFLEREHGWTWRQGPEPYNNVYVRPGVEHLSILDHGINFFQESDQLYAEAKKLGFHVSQQEDDEIGSEESELEEEAAESEVDDSSVSSPRKSRRAVGFAQKQIESAMSTAHISLSVQDEMDGTDEEEKDHNQSQGEVPEEEEDEDEEEEAGIATEEEEEDDSEDESFADLDDALLCGDSKILTRRSAHVCARLIRKFATLSDTDSEASFNNLLWTPLWEQIKGSQGGDHEDLKFNYGKSRGQLASRSFWYVAPQSKGSSGKPGTDYFETEEAVVEKVLREVKQLDYSLLAASQRQIDAFDTVLTRAVENNVAYSESRKNPDIGGKRRNRRHTTGDNSPYVYSPPKKAKIAKAKKVAQPKSAKAKTRTESPTKSALKAKAPSPSKRVAFAADSMALSQNTREGVESLLALNPSSADVHSGSAATTPTTPREREQDANTVPTTPSYTDIATPDGIESLRKLRSQTPQHDKTGISASPKKRGATTAAPSSSDRKKQKMASPVRGATPSSTDTRLSQIPYQLCESDEDMSQSDDVSSFSRRVTVKRTNGSRRLPLDGIKIFGSGLETKQSDLIKELGGEYMTDTASLLSTDMFGKLFFVSHVMQRRKIKYILASTLGCPMLHYSWLTAIREEFRKIENGDEDEDTKAKKVRGLAFHPKLFQRMRLPTGLSIKSGLYKLQKAKHAKKWHRPGQEHNMKLILSGMKLTVALEKEEAEKEWESILTTAGATVVKRSSLKNGKKCHLDAVLVDRNSLPPHTTAVPPNITRCFNFIKAGNAKTSSGIAKIPIIDLSWALQCIVERERLSWDIDERFVLYSDASKSGTSGGIKMFEMKAKTDERTLVRFEVGDIVEFGRTKNASRIGRILSIYSTGRACTSRNLDIQLLDKNGNYELIDDENATHVTINETELQRHIVLLSSRDFKDIKEKGYLPKQEKDTHIFVQKKPPSAKRTK